MNKFELNLKAHRCPSAMTMARVAIRQGVSADGAQLKLHSIEPMLVDHIRAFLAADHPRGYVESVEDEPITDAMLQEWRNGPEGFDDDDFEMAYHRITITINL